MLYFRILMFNFLLMKLAPKFRTIKDYLPQVSTNTFKRCAGIRVHVYKN